MPTIDLSILNQRQTPAFYADVFANRPAAGYIGRIFVSTDTFAFYRDNGTGWDLIGGPGTGTITGSGASGQIALWSGASTIAGDTGLTYDGTDNSLTASKFIVTGGTSSQFLKADGSVDSSSYVPYTGATASLDMGANNLLGQNFFVRGDNSTSGGFLGFRQFSGSSSGTTGYTSISALQQNSLYFQYSQTDGSNKVVELSTALLGTTPRQFLFPDADGTLALTSDILNIYNSNGSLTAERTINLNAHNLIFDGGASVARIRLDADTNVARIFSFASNNLPRWAFRIDDTESGSEAGSNFALRRYNDAGTFVDAPLTVTRSTGQSTFAKKVVIENNAGDQQLQIVSTTAPSLRIDNAQTGATKRIGIGISTATNNFIQGSTDRDMCIFNGSTTASPILFGIYDTTNVQEAARISTARNLLVGTSVDAGYKLDINGTGRFTGLITSTSASDILTATSSNTSYKWINLANTGANLVVGLNNSAGSATMTTNAYASYIFTRNATDLVLGTNEVPRLTIASTGAATFTGNLTMQKASSNAIFTMDSTIQSNYIFMKYNGAAQWYIGHGIGGPDDSSFQIYNGSGTRALTILQSTNNVLIGGTTDNGYKTQINGSAYINGPLCATTSGGFDRYGFIASVCDGGVNNLSSLFPNVVFGSALLGLKITFYGYVGGQYGFFEFMCTRDAATNWNFTCINYISTTGSVLPSLTFGGSTGSPTVQITGTTLNTASFEIYSR